jgi:plastocyanin
MRLTTSAGRRARPSITLAATVLTGVLALAGCGSSSKSSSSSSEAPATTSSSTASTSSAASSGSTGGASSKLSLAADPGGQLKFDKSSLTAKAGTVTITYTNSAPLEHNLNIESSSGSVVGSTPTFQGGSKTLSVSLKPGTYKFYCSVPGHRQAGMEGTLTVQ